MNWSKQSDGLGKGLGATDPLPNPGNNGNGAMSDVTIDPSVLSETWTIACKSEATDGGVFSVTGSRSGARCPEGCPGQGRVRGSEVNPNGERLRRVVAGVGPRGVGGGIRAHSSTSAGASIEES